MSKHHLIIIPKSGGPFDPKKCIGDNVFLTDSLLKHMNLDHSVAMAQCPSVKRDTFFPKQIERIVFNGQVISRMENKNRSEIFWIFSHLAKNWPEHLLKKGQAPIVIGKLSVDDLMCPVYIYFDNNENKYICDDDLNEIFPAGTIFLLPPRVRNEKF